MRRNCNLELRLNTSITDSGFPLRNSHAVDESMSAATTSDQQRQPLTIFYDGVMCVSNVTELQARAILFLASKEMEERSKTSPLSTSAAYSEPSSPNLQPSTPICSPSMKKSLQTFLQKRKYRIQATSHPYRR